MLLLLQLERHGRPHGLKAAPGAPGRADRATREGARGRGRPIAPHPLGHGPPPPRRKRPASAVGRVLGGGERLCGARGKA